MYKSKKFYPPLKLKKSKKLNPMKLGRRNYKLMYMGIIIIFLIINFFVLHSFSYVIQPGPKYNATKGSIWPKPMSQENGKGIFLIDPNRFEFEVIGNTCDILEKALKRYKDIMRQCRYSLIRDFETTTTNQKMFKIQVNLTTHCETYPHLKMDEWYLLSTKKGILSHSIWGILRGLESFSQLIVPTNYGMLKIPEVNILDSPKFPHRGLLLDTSRHYISMSVILKILDGMAYNKMNVFHWHIVDDQSFPYVSKKFPELSEKGAYIPWMVYTQKDVANVIDYARLRGIRVISEFDVPGHTRSWGNSHPELLAKCGEPYEGFLGPINPIKETSYTFLKEFFNEVMEVFPDKYVHLGGDEVGFECWNSNQEIAQYMRDNKINPEHLQKEFMEKITRTITEKSFIPIVWQEAMVQNVNMPEGTIVQVWLGEWRQLIGKLTKQGHRVLLSACWYLDHLNNDWRDFYECDPLSFNGDAKQKELVLGGEACMWSEMVNDQNVLTRIFPRVSAAAERLWSRGNYNDVRLAVNRIEEHTHRMILRGIPAQPPSGPGIL